MTALRQAKEVFSAFMAREDLPASLSTGMLLGYSGGADSTLLLALLAEYCQKADIPLLAFHVNHGIRGAQSDAEEAACAAECARRGIDFRSVRLQVPEAARMAGKGLEETARRMRYSAFFEACLARGYRVIVTAHHATDHAETVLLQLLRGGGGTALCGIHPVRACRDDESGFDGYLLRPLLGLTAEEIRAAAEEGAMAYAEDPSNRDLCYRRNFLRAEVLPRLRQIAPHAEEAFLRMSENIACDMSYLDAQAEAAYAALAREGRLDRAGFAALHPAVGYRVLLLLHQACCGGAAKPERVHTDALFSLLARRPTESFSLDFPSDVRLCADGKYLFFRLSEECFSHGHIKLHLGENLLADGSRIILCEEKDTTKFVYKNAIHRSLSSAKINGCLYVRSRQEGDAYRYGGMTHRVKKLMADAKLPASERARWPIVCDADGIVWVPGFGVRTDGGKHNALGIYYVQA